tara:strand:- start:13357 stop:14820 length:1464 start_codon:yes stop_codon:yes gene_type:complete
MPIISATGISKKYSLRDQQTRRRGLGALIREIVGPAEATSDSVALSEGEFWALRDVDLSVSSGDTLGVIGLNGAGKTTLMSLLAGVVKPDTGSVVHNGDVQAVLSLGAGINAKLTGRQNAESGVALRATSTEQREEMIARIESFSELGEFFDSPVGYYSSGMRARLGFAICISATPQAILIDEALSVGDASFKQKCLLYLEQLRRRGVGMVMVSHSMTSIRQFCDSAIWVHDGQIRARGPSGEVVHEYLEFVEQRQSSSLAAPAPARQGDKPILPVADRAAATDASPIKSVTGTAFNASEASPAVRTLGPVERELHLSGQPGEWIRPNITATEVNELYGRQRAEPGVDEFGAVMLVNGQPTNEVRPHECVEIEYRFRLRDPAANLNVSLVFHKEGSGRLATISTLNKDLLKGLDTDGLVHCKVRVSDMVLAPGDYVVTISIHDGKPYLWRDVILAFRVRTSDLLTWGDVNMPYSYEVYTAVDQADAE